MVEGTPRVLNTKVPGVITVFTGPLDGPARTAERICVKFWWVLNFTVQPLFCITLFPRAFFFAYRKDRRSLETTEGEV